MNRTAQLTVLLLAVGMPAAIAATSLHDSDQLAYNLRTTVEAYDRLGVRSAKWDEAARKCLTAFARIRSTTNDVFDSLVTELKETLPTIPAAERRDPLVHYLFLRYSFLDNHSVAECAEAFGKAADDLRKSQYPAIRKFWATNWARRLQQEAGAPEDITSELSRRAAAHLAEALADPSIPPREAKECMEALLSPIGPSGSLRWECYRLVEKPLTNRWPADAFSLLAKGRAFLSHAWTARGTGYADTVTEQGWADTGSRLEVAAEALESAWRINQQDVQICVEMMRVELMRNKGRGEMERWFQRGMSLDPANAQLCRDKLHYLRPRWHGSEAEMISFGRHCTTNAAWEGEVKLLLAEAHTGVVQELQSARDRHDYWLQPKVWPDIKLTFDQYFRLYPDNQGWRHDYARYAFKCGQWQAFKDQVNQFPSTNHTFFGGVVAFNEMVSYAEAQLKKN